MPRLAGTNHDAHRIQCVFVPKAAAKRPEIRFWKSGEENRFNSYLTSREQLNCLMTKEPRKMGKQKVYNKNICYKNCSRLERHTWSRIKKNDKNNLNLTIQPVL